MGIFAIITGLVWGVRLILRSKWYWKVIGAGIAAKAAYDAAILVTQRVKKELEDVIEKKGSPAEIARMQKKAKRINSIAIKDFEKSSNKFTKVLEAAKRQKPPKRNGILFKGEETFEELFK